ncbi:MAG: M3 family oligoendopeptidase [Clostridia bacterium]
MKKRSEIDEKYKWDLSSYVKDEVELKQNLQYLQDNVNKFKEYYNNLTDKSILKEYLKTSEYYEDILIRSVEYVGLNLETDFSDAKYLSWEQKFENVMQKYNETTSFVEPQMMEFPDEYLNELIADEELKDYDLIFKNILKSKDHKISEQETELLSKMSNFLGNDSNVFYTLTNGELYFEDALDSKGNKHIVSDANYRKLMENSDRVLRKNSYLSSMKEYCGKNRTLASLYINDIKADIFHARLAKFDNVKQERMFEEQVDESVYNNLLKNINQRLNIMHKIMELKAKYLNISDFANYDLAASKEINKEFSMDDSIKMLKQCVKLLGDDYQSKVDYLLNVRAIDWLPNENKNHGGFSVSLYKCLPVILLNHVNSYESLNALVHEIGHSVHALYSHQAQPRTKGECVIFTAEVASTVNEILLSIYLLKNANNEDKNYYLFQLFNNIIAAVFMQSMYSEFEDYTHTQLENDKILTYKECNDKWYELNKKYYGDKVVLLDEIKYGWSKIHHFYRPFYVYKYATGFISALCIVQNLLEDSEYYKKYINFLKSGCSKPPVELLQDIGVDLTTDEPYNKAFKFIENLINELNI